jgi:hypothetical protein
MHVRGTYGVLLAGVLVVAMTSALTVGADENATSFTYSRDTQHTTSKATRTSSALFNTYLYIDLSRIPSTVAVKTLSSSIDVCVQKNGKGVKNVKVTTTFSYGNADRTLGADDQTMKTPASGCVTFSYPMPNSGISGRDGDSASYFVKFSGKKADAITATARAGLSPQCDTNRDACLGFPLSDNRRYEVRIRKRQGGGSWQQGEGIDLDGNEWNTTFTFPNSGALGVRLSSRTTLRAGEANGGGQSTVVAGNNLVLDFSRLAGEAGDGTYEVTVTDTLTGQSRTETFIAIGGVSGDAAMSLP